MILTEKMTINGKSFVRTWSDAGKMVEREGVSYAEAIDPAQMGRTNTETDIPIEDDVEAEEILNILLGGES